MRFFTVAALLAAVAFAHPLENALLEVRNAGGDRITTDDPSDVCSQSLYSNPQCCSSLLGNIGLDCHAPIGEIHDVEDLREECIKSGDEAFCCIVPIAGRVTLCVPHLA
ncbi:hydrophobin [Trichoderma velutinum]